MAATRARSVPASEDLKRVMALIHQEGWTPDGHKVHISNREKDQFVSTELQLRRGAESQVFKSEEFDVSDLAFHLQRITGPDGKPHFRKMRDLNKYWADVDALIDQDGAKLRAAIARVQQGKWKPSYDSDRLLEEVYLSAGRPYGKRYLPLKQDYFEITGRYLILGAALLGDQQRIVKEKPEAQRFIDAAGQAFAIFVRNKNPIENFRRFRTLVEIDLIVYTRKSTTQREAIDATLRDLLAKGSMHAKEAIPRLLDLYNKVLELSAPVLNMLRIALQMRVEDADPAPQKGLTENIHLIRADPTFGGVFDCLEAPLRHGNAHASYEIEGDIVRVWDDRRKPAKIIGEYKFERVAEVVRTAEQFMFPVLVNQWLMAEIAMKNLILINPEHKFFILGVDNS